MATINTSDAGHITEKIQFATASLSSRQRSAIQQAASDNAATIGLTPQEWQQMRKQRGRAADIMMAFDPEGERRLIQEQSKIGKKQ